MDFWTLDVEGAEWEVLQTVDFDRIRVDVIMIEIGADAAQDQRIFDFLATKGYRKDQIISFNAWFVGPHYRPPPAGL